MPQAIVSRVTFRINVRQNGAVFLDITKRSRSEVRDDADHLPTLAEASQQIVERFAHQLEQDGRLHPQEVRLTAEELEELRKSL